jgi:hypothetical protein
MSIVMMFGGDALIRERRNATTSPLVLKAARLNGTCVHSAKGGCKLIVALSWLKCDFFGILRVRKRWLLCLASFLCSSWL